MERAPIKKHRIAFLISHPIQYNSQLFKEMADYPGIDLTVMYCSKEGTEEMEDIEFQKRIKWDIPLLEGYKYKFLKNYSPKPTVFNLPFGLVNIGIVEEVRDGAYDAIIVHGWHYFTHRLAFIIARLKKTPIFIRSDSPLCHEFLKPKWKILIKKIALRALFKFIKVFLAIGSENREFYKFYGAEEGRMYSMPYAVDNKKFFGEYSRLIGKKNDIRKELGIPPEKIVILFVGKLIPKKRPKDLLMAYEKLSAKDKTLIFVGDGELKEDLGDYVEKNNLENVFFAGFINQREIGKYYVASDVLVLPSTMGESWGLVVNEAMCFRLPIVVSDLVGCGRDLVRQGENGFVFKTGDVEELAQYLDRSMNDPDLRRAMGSKSFEVIQKWDYEADLSGIIRALEAPHDA
ncbi:MAG: glycosyltransferase family 4 protein [Candidatus Omnitrophica bacterium]|nr:glycosyltransferase family 4 protein [Candidatus Omnitrophota bacterium]